MCFWLKKLGANVVGVGLKPEKTNILFNSLRLEKKIDQHILDIRNYKTLNNIIKKEKPDITFHLAAQSIVSESYKEPLSTIEINTLGSTNLLEIIKNNNLKKFSFYYIRQMLFKIKI